MCVCVCVGFVSVSGGWIYDTNVILQHYRWPLCQTRWISLSLCFMLFFHTTYVLSYDGDDDDDGGGGDDADDVLQWKRMNCLTSEDWEWTGTDCRSVSRTYTDIHAHILADTQIVLAEKNILKYLNTKYTILLKNVFEILPFLPRCMECRCNLAIKILSVRPYVRLSNACIVTKRKKAMFRFLYHTKEHLS